MDRIIRELETQGITIYYTDTDSYVISVKRGQKVPLVEGPCFDMFKNELPHCRITSFYSLGPKIYQLQYESAKDLTLHTMPN